MPHPVSLALALLVAAAPKPAALDPDEGAVLAAAIPGLAVPGGPFKQWVLSPVTSTGDAEIARADILANVPDVNLDALEDFFRRNAQPAALTVRTLRLQGAVTLLPDPARDELLGADSPWEAFFSRFPDAPGLTTVSRVGLDRSRRHALVYVANVRGVKDGAGDLLVLERGTSGWRVRAALRTWEPQ